MNNVNKRINLIVNLAIILVLVLIGIIFTKNYLLSARATNPKRDYRVPAGTKVSLPGVDWEDNGKTLLLVLDTKCRYCTASAPFYQQLAREAAQNRSVKLIAVLPQDISESKQYLSSLNVPIDEVRQAEFKVLGVQGTPTLILVNKNSEVMRSWPGKLALETETEVLKQIEENS